MADEIGLLLEREDFQQTIEAGFIGRRENLLSMPLRNRREVCEGR
jgi:hypothetical protein